MPRASDTSLHIGADKTVFPTRTHHTLGALMGMAGHKTIPHVSSKRSICSGVCLFPRGMAVCPFRPSGPSKDSQSNWYDWRGAGQFGQVHRPDSGTLAGDLRQVKGEAWSRFLTDTR